MSPVNFSKFMLETISCVLLCDLWTVGNEKVESLNCFFPFSVKELQASLSLKVKLI